MPVCHILVGPPGSGKSTYAQTLEKKEVVRISQDDQGKEGHFKLFKQALEQGSDVVVDRMNFNAQQRIKYLTEAKNRGYRTIATTFYIPKSICYDRCIERQGHPTIKDQESAGRALSTFFSKFEFPSIEEGFDELVEVLWTDENKQLAIISDLDGTLCDIDHRLHLVKGEGKKDWKSFFENLIYDKPNLWCQDIIHRYKQDTVIVLCSGRPDNYKKLTEEWLYENNVEYDKLFMRPRNDMRQDALIKKIIYKFEINTRYDILFVLDDRQTVINGWRDLGLVALQCAPGHF
jgi:hypothetical protein